MKRHGFDPFSLLFGAIFASVGVSFLIGSTIGEARGDAWPVVAVILGGILATWACATAYRQSRHSREALTEPR